MAFLIAIPQSSDFDTSSVVTKINGVLNSSASLAEISSNVASYASESGSGMGALSSVDVSGFEEGDLSCVYVYIDSPTHSPTGVPTIEPTSMSFPLQQDIELLHWNCLNRIRLTLLVFSRPCCHTGSHCEPHGKSVQ